jgi:hypothetical protein
MEGRARPRDLGLAGRRAAELALELETVVTTGELMLDVVAVLVMQVLTVACRIPDGFNPTFNWKNQPIIASRVTTVPQVISYLICIFPTFLLLIINTHLPT